MLGKYEPLEIRVQRDIDVLKEKVSHIREEVARLVVENKELTALADGFKREMVRLTDEVARLRTLLDGHMTSGRDDDEGDPADTSSYYWHKQHGE